MPLPASLLSTVGVIVSALVTGLAAHLLFDVSWLILGTRVIE